MSLFLSSFALAIAFCAPPGVVAAETVRRGFARGFWPAFLVQLGSLIGDSVWAVLALLGAAALIQNWVARIILSLFGIGFLVYLAVKAIKDSRKEIVYESVANPGRGDLVTGALLSLSNPFAIAFWISVSTSIFSNVSGLPKRSDYIIFFFAFYLGLSLWCLFMAIIVAWGRRFVTTTFYRLVNLSCGIAMGFYAFQLGWKLIQNLV